MTILDNIIPSTEVQNKSFLSVMLLGPSGSGKSTSACTFPGKKLVIDLDNRAHSLADFPDVDIFPCFETSHVPKAWNQFETLKKALQVQARDPSTFPYSTIIIDGLTAINNISMNWALLLDPKRGLGGSPALHHYGPQMNAIRKELMGFLGLPCHIVLTGHPELIENQEDGTTKVLPKTTGKLRTEIANWFDECYKCYRVRVKKEVHYFWDTTGIDQDDFYKSSLNIQGKKWTSPVRVNLDEDPTGFAALLSLPSSKGGENGS